LGPAGQRQAVVACLPALPNITPIVPTPLALDNAFDVACLFKLEEAGLFNVLELTFSE
jgi:hypothetical protein